MDLHIRSCLFRSNVAYQSGGAIFAVGPPALTLTIERSIFDANAVRPPADAGMVDVTVLVNTGGFIIPDAVDLNINAGLRSL